MSERDNYDTRFDYKYPTSSKTSPNKRNTPRDYDGVEYIPSGGAPQRTPQNTSQRGRRQGSERYGRTSGGGSYYSGGSSGSGGKKKVKPQSQSAMFMALIVGVGVLICFGAFFLMFALTRPSPVKAPDDMDAAAEDLLTEGDTDIETAEAAVADAVLNGAIKSVSDGTVTIVSVEDDSVSDIYVNADTSFRNKYGQAMTLSQFGEGDIVIAEYDSVNKKALVFRLDPEAWIKPSVRNIEIGPETASVKVSNETLSISKNVVFIPAGTSASVKPSDVVTLKGSKTKVMAVSVEKRSGTIEIVNKDKILDGTVEVDADIYKALEETGSLKVSTGVHTVVVKGANIDAFIKEVTVNEGETVVIDLAEAQIKEGVVNLNVNEPDYTLSVNDEVRSSTQEPLKLPFGSYKLKVSKEGFTPWEGNVSVNQPSVDVNVTLAQEVKMGKISVIITDPAGLANCSVYIDNALVGTAPINRASVTYGTHQLTIKAPGYMDTSTPIIVEGDTSYNVTMNPIIDNSGGINNNGNTDNAGNTGNTGNTGDTGLNTTDPFIQ